MDFFSFFSYKQTRGFTLLELLVVISIIGFLSSTALVSLGDAQTKVRNTARLQIAKEYEKAIILARETYDTYPVTPDTNRYYCLGDFDDDACGSGGIGNQEYGPLLTTIGEFYPGLPTLEQVPIGRSGRITPWEGPLYQCSEIIGGICTRVEMMWFTEGLDTIFCGNAEATARASLGATRCLLTFEI